MEKSTKGKIVFWSVVALVLASGTYALANHFNNKNKNKSNGNPPPPPIPPATLGNGSGSHTDPVYTVVSPLHTMADIKAFQNFANTKGMGLVVDGIWGVHTAAAWAEYGADFLKQGSTGSSTSGAKFKINDLLIASGDAVGTNIADLTTQKIFPSGTLLGRVQTVHTTNPPLYDVYTSSGTFRVNGDHVKLYQA